MLERSKCCIIGIPDHQGVIHVGGRIGAAGGPKAFRQILNRFQGRVPHCEILRDLGDVEGLTGDIVQNHQLATDFVKKGHLQTALSVVVGGGHDHGYSHLSGVSAALKTLHPKMRLGCINIDAHLDVRKPAPLITSGSPFYLALESGILHPKRFLEFGIQDHCNSPILWKYIDEKKVKVLPFSELRQGKAVSLFRKSLKKIAAVSDAVVISLDLDAAAAAFAPGVSSPQAEGFSPMEVIEMMEIAGYERKVISLGIFELNPEQDADGCTARLAATAAFHFMERAILRR